MARCSSCNQTFNGRDALVHHQRVSQHCFCLCCDLSFPNDGMLQKHNKSKHHHGCNACHEVFSSRDELLWHQKEAAHCYCVTCKRHFQSTKVLIEHLRTSKFHIFQCSKCQKKSKQKMALEQHQGDAHHQCYRCGENFLSRAERENHLAQSETWLAPLGPGGA